MDPSFITLPYRLERAAPRFESNAIKYPESLVRHFLKTFTKRGETVFDPFAGLGTTLFVAEALGRIPYGMEADPQRHAWVAGQMRHWNNLVCGDSFDLRKAGFPKMDFCMASPPFMARDHRWNPLYAGDPDKAGYAQYLKRMKAIYSRVAAVMKRGGAVVVHADNLHGRAYTPLVHDLAAAIGGVMRLENEIIVAWEDGPKDYAHTHCLVFRNAGSA